MKTSRSIVNKYTQQVSRTLPVPRLRGRLGQVRCRKVSWGCFGGRHLLEFFVALCCKMGKFSCCVPGCTNNWRNSPEKKFHTLPSDAKVRRLYEKLIRNENLKLNAQHTRICGDHFPDGERMCRTQLPSIFPWTAIPEKRRTILMKADLVMSLHANRLFSGRACSCKKDPCYPGYH